MKVMTISGETLRKEFTALECAALKHAAEYCTVGDVFTGVPTSSEERYRRCQQQFEVVEHDGENLTVKKCGTDRVLFAKIGGKSQKHVPQPEPEPQPEPMPQPMPQPAPSPAPQPEPQIEDVEAEEVDTTPSDPQPSEIETSGAPSPSSSLGAFAALFDGMAGDITAKVMAQMQKQMQKQMEAMMAKQTPQSVKHEHTIKVGEMQNKIEGITHPKFDRILKYVANHRNVYLYGPAGSGKNVICEQVAKALGVPFYYQNTVMTKFDLTGYKNAGGEFEDTEFFKAFTQGGVFMLDEIDNAMAEALVALNAALANGYYSFPGIGRVEAHKDFYCVAAGNTNGQGATDEYNGRYKMDESSRDRFAFVEIDYCEEIENAIAGDRKDVLEFVRELRSICKTSRISLICGYRAIKNLVAFYDDDPREIIEDFILKGMEQDSIREIAMRMGESSNKFVKAFKQIAEK